MRNPYFFTMQKEFLMRNVTTSAHKDLQYYSKIIAEGHDNWAAILEAHYECGAAYLKLGEYNKALKEFTERIQMDPTNANVFNSRGVVYSHLHDFKKADCDFRQAIVLKSDDPLPYINRGINFFAWGKKTQKALKNLTRAIELDPSLSSAYNNRGLIYLSKSKYRLALNDFNDAITLSTDDMNPRTYAHRGLTYAKLNEPLFAIRDLHIALQIDAHYAEAYRYLGDIYYQLEVYPESAHFYTQAIQNKPSNPDYYVCRGDVYYKQSQLDSALTDYSRALELDHRLLIAYKKRARIYQQLQRDQEAQKDYGKIEELSLVKLSLWQRCLPCFFTHTENSVPFRDQRRIHFIN